jgi:hypothetical protein
MIPELHRMKAQRIETSMEKLSDADYEAVIEGSMLAGSHWLNFACHRMELTGHSADVMHAEFLTGAQRVELSFRSAACNGSNRGLSGGFRSRRSACWRTGGGALPQTA